MIRVIRSALPALLLCGCMTTEPLNEQGRTVQVMTSDPPKGCTELGLISPSTFNECGNNYYVFWATIGTVEGTRNCFRNMTAALGGNYFRLEGPRVGTAFKCPDMRMSAE